MLPPVRRDRSLRSIRALWLPELVVLVALAIVAAVAFSGSRLDRWAIPPFHRAGGPAPWPLARAGVGRWGSLAPPWITGSLAAFGGGLFLAGFAARGQAHLRMHGLFVLLAVAIGPGLIVNAGLKDHWGRPRPREIRELGGHAAYSPALVPSGAGGKSFACGHCSVGFLYALGWWIWRRRARRLALASLVLGLAVGGVLVVDRMAAGGHFLSDGVWAALIALGVAHALYYYVLRIPLREPDLPGDQGRSGPASRLTAVGVSAGAAAILAVVTLSWRYVDLSAHVNLPDSPVDSRFPPIALMSKSI